MKQPLISVIIPAYNAETYIEETLNSVLQQTYENYEVIVVNDGSTDGTLDIIKRYEDRVRFYDIKNSGVSYARNFAVKQANGEWLAFLDADDLWDSEKLAIQFSNLNDKLWSHCNSYYIGEEQTGTVTRAELSHQSGGAVFEKLANENFITTSTVLINKQLFIDNGGFDEAMSALEDWKLWLDIAYKNPIAYVEAPVAKYRVYQGSTSRKARKMLPLHLNVINHAFSKNNCSNSAIKTSAIAQSYTICSYLAEDSKDYRYSFRCAIAAMWYGKFKAALTKRAVRALLNLAK